MYGIARGSEGAETNKVDSGTRDKVDRMIGVEARGSNVSGIDDAAIGSSDGDRRMELRR